MKDRIIAARLGIGLFQGLVLYLLYRAGDARVWPATHPMLFVPLGLIALFVPLIVSQGLTVMRARTLAIWAGAAAVLLAVLGAYDRYRIWMPDIREGSGASGILNANQPEASLIALCVATLFILQALVAGADMAGTTGTRRWIAPYARYFEAAWKQGVQCALSVAFTGAFWLVLWLGASLFKLIGLTFLETLITHVWFAIPATALALAAAIHVSDLRANLIEGIRALALALLSWLLPLLAALAAGFLIALVFTGLDPLWKTKSAAAILLAACGALVVLANAAFQDGDAGRAVPAPMRWAGMAAGLILPGFTVIAAYAICLRVGQYGWTAERVIAAAVTFVALAYAGGYLAADIMALRRRPWRGIVETTNIAAAILAVVVAVLLFSPIADPARIAANSQVARLTRGAVPPARFDFRWLRYEGTRHGHDALASLAGSGDAAIAGPARAMLAERNGTRISPPSDAAPGPLDVRVFPAGRTLPDTLLRQWPVLRAKGQISCPGFGSARCEAYYVALDDDNRDEILLVGGGQAAVLTSDAAGAWSLAGHLSPLPCPSALAAMQKGQFAVVAPDPPRWHAIEAPDARFSVVPAPPPAARSACAP